MWNELNCNDIIQVRLTEAIVQQHFDSCLHMWIMSQCQYARTTWVLFDSFYVPQLSARYGLYIYIYIYIYRWSVTCRLSQRGQTDPGSQHPVFSGLPIQLPSTNWGRRTWHSLPLDSWQHYTLQNINLLIIRLRWETIALCLVSWVKLYINWHENT